MKKHRQKASSKAPILDRQPQAQDLVRVRGGENGVIHMDAVDRGRVSTNDNGVIHMA
jgi:hypothetical protein